MCTRVKRHMLTKKQYPLLSADECALRVARLLPSLCMFAIELARLVWFLFFQRERTRNKTHNFGIPKMCTKNHLGNQLSISKLCGRAEAFPPAAQHGRKPCPVTGCAVAYACC